MRSNIRDEQARPRVLLQLIPHRRQFSRIDLEAFSAAIGIGVQPGHPFRQKAGQFGGREGLESFKLKSLTPSLGVLADGEKTRAGVQQPDLFGGKRLCSPARLGID